MKTKMECSPLIMAAMTSPIVKSIQEQQEEIEALKKQNTDLKKRLDEIEALLKKIAAKNK
jgi:type II secretory pathway component PulM